MRATALGHRQSGAGAEAPKSRAPRSSAALGATPGGVEAFLAEAGLDPADFTVRSRAAIAALIERIERLEADNERIRARAAALERLAHQDTLMPVGNRRAFVRELSRLITLSKRYGIHSSVVFLDLNGMKAINDRFGHAAGDAALRHVSRLLVDNVRHADIVARLGGDEFGVLLVKTDAAAAATKAAALVAAIAAQPLVWNETSIELSVAFGAYVLTGEESVAEAIERADRAMYRNKRPAAADEAPGAVR